MKIGETLRDIRKAKKISQEKISAQSFLDRSSYTRIEGNKKDVRFQDLCLILKNMGINPMEFFSLAMVDEEQQNFRDLFSYCVEHLGNQKKKMRC